MHRLVDTSPTDLYLPIRAQPGGGASRVFPPGETAFKGGRLGDILAGFLRKWSNPSDREEEELLKVWFSSSTAEAWGDCWGEPRTLCRPTWMFPITPVDSMRLATLTVLPQMS